MRENCGSDEGEKVRGSDCGEGKGKRKKKKRGRRELLVALFKRHFTLHGWMIRSSENKMMKG